MAFWQSLKQSGNAVNQFFLREVSFSPSLVTGWLALAVGEFSAGAGQGRALTVGFDSDGTGRSPDDKR